jgi:penicillin-binding protein-related factor A (putative recombinase)
MMAWRNNTVGVYDPILKIHRKQPKYTMKGASDIFMLYKGTFVAMEVKRIKNSSPVSEDQIKFIERINDNGGMACVVRSVADAAEIVRQLKRSE